MITEKSTQRTGVFIAKQDVSAGFDRDLEANLFHRYITAPINWHIADMLASILSDGRPYVVRQSGQRKITDKYVDTYSVSVWVSLRDYGDAAIGEHVDSLPDGAAQHDGRYFAGGKTFIRDSGAYQRVG